MTPERWQEIDKLLERALEQEPKQRQAFLDKACAGDEELRREVESLLEVQSQAEGFLGEPALDAVARDISCDEPPSLIGRQLGHYQILSQLGEGGMGVVYKARDRQLDRYVAVKVLPPSLLADRYRKKRFVQEAKAASALKHPNVAHIYEIGEWSGGQFIAMEYIEGETLTARIANRPLDPSEVAEVGSQIADALDEAHSKWITHRDIKPANIMLTQRGQVKVLDFGLAKVIRPKGLAASSDVSTEAHTGSGVVMGTMEFMSPEQALGKEVDHRTDLFSLGVVLYHMATGRLPFSGKSPNETLDRILHAEPDAIARFNYNAPAELERIVRKCLDKDRERRYQSARELLVDLRNLRRETDSRVAPAQKVHQPARSLGRLALVSVALLVMLTLGAALLYLQIASKNQGRTNDTPTISRTVQITSWSGLDFYPSISPDGNTVAFSSDRTGSFEIYVKQLVAGAREVQLTSDGEQNFQPAFSPDGTLIAYHSKKRRGIWVVPMTGGAAKQLTEFGSHPAWSPDGSQIAFQSDPLNDFGPGAVNAMPPSTIWLVSAKGGEPKQLTQSGKPVGGHGAPAWSPDGKRIVFDTNDWTNCSVWSLTSQGEDLKQIFSPKLRMALDAAYAPDGKSIFVIGGAGVSLEVIKVSEAGEPIGEPVKLLDASGTRIRQISMAAKGNRIVYTTLLTVSNIWATPLAPNTKEANRNPIQLTQTAHMRATMPLFSPDGKGIAYHSYTPGSRNHIWTMDADGKNQRQITTGRIPRWFPDGRRIAFWLPTNEDRLGLWSITVDSGKEKKLFDLAADGSSFPRISADGKQVAFNSKKTGTSNIWIIPIEGGEAKQLTFDEELAAYPAWSPDGKWMGFQIKRGEDTHVSIIPIEGGEPVQLTFDKGQSWVNEWSPDGGRIIFAGQRDGIWNVHWVSRSTKEQKQLTNFTKPNSYVRYPAYSPTGDKIAYEYAETNGNIWMIELK